MHIVFSSNSSWSVYNFRKNLLVQFVESGYKVTVVAPYSNYLSRFSTISIDIYEIAFHSSTKSILSNLKLIYDLYKVYKFLKPDVVLHNAVKPNIYGSMVCGVLGIPVINNISGFGSLLMSPGFSNMFARLLFRLSQRKVIKVFFQNSSDIEYFLGNGLVKQSQCELIPGSGVDIDRFCPKPKKVNSEIKFCYIGRIIGDKGILEYINAIKILRKEYTQISFHVIGELYREHPTSINQKEVDEWVNSGIIEFHGMTDNIQDEYCKYDCIVLPSYREGLSKVLLEACASGIPAITTNVPGCRDVIEHGLNGFLCEPGDSEDLAKWMEKFTFLSHKEREIMGKYGRNKVVEQFNEQLVIRSYQRAVNSITSTNDIA